LGCSSACIARWQTRFAEQRPAGLFDRHQGRPATKRTPRLEARILAWTRRPGTGVNHTMIARIWQRDGLKPYRMERYMASDYSDFERKAANVVGLYVDRPAQTAMRFLKRPRTSRIEATRRSSIDSYA
jgi:hypothetical protein